MAETVAAEIGAVVIEGGAWYRALTYIAGLRGVSAQDTGALVALASGLAITVAAKEGGAVCVH